MQLTSDKPVITLTKGLGMENTLGTWELDPGVATHALSPSLGWASLNRGCAKKYTAAREESMSRYISGYF